MFKLSTYGNICTHRYHTRITTMSYLNELFKLNILTSPSRASVIPILQFYIISCTYKCNITQRLKIVKKNCTVDDMVSRKLTRYTSELLADCLVAILSASPLVCAMFVISACSYVNPPSTGRAIL